MWTFFQLEIVDLEGNIKKKARETPSLLISRYDLDAFKISLHLLSVEFVGPEASYN